MGGMAVLWVVAALAPQTSLLQVNSYAHLSVAQYRSSPANGVGGDAGVELDLYQRPLRDDDSPLSLQPFLQRDGTIWIDAAGGGSQLDNGGFSSRSRSGSASAGVDLYVHPWVAITASFGGGAGSGDDSNGLHHQSWILRGSAGLGVRWDDVRFDIRYALSGGYSDGQPRTPFYGNFVLGAEIVVQRRLDVVIDVETIDDGVLASFYLEGFARRRLGGYLGFGGGAAHPGASVPFRSAFGKLGVAPWWSRHFGVNIAYQATWNTGPGYEVIEHLLTLVLRSRAR